MEDSISRTKAKKSNILTVQTIEIEGKHILETFIYVRIAVVATQTLLFLTCKLSCFFLLLYMLLGAVFAC